MNVAYCVVKLLGGIGWCRAARHCQSLGVWLGPRTWGVPVKLLGRDVGCIWPSSCLVAGCTLLVGVDKLFGGTERQLLRAVTARDLGSSCGA